ncbi:MAG: hypothetical protein Q7S87_16180 [Agitococcus sp.]|nr:hypothetical protein [Agitococcus sp.]
MTISPVFAAVTIQGPVCWTATHLGFTNGIQNTSEQAMHSLLALRTHAVARGLPATSIYSFYHQKGRTGQEGALTSFKLDVMEVFWQQAQASVGNDPEKEAYAMLLFFHALGAPSPFFDKTNANLISALLMNLSQVEDARLALSLQTATAATIKKETSQDVAKLHSILSKGDLLMMAAHSQGTFSANSALQEFAKQYPQFASQVRLSSAGMAADKVWQTPRSAVPNAYVTSTNDIVINTLRTVSIAKNLVPTAPANYTHGITTKDLNGHSFEDIYLDEAAETGTQFMKIFSASFAQLAVGNSAKVFSSDLTYTIDFGRAAWTPQHIEIGSDSWGFSWSLSQSQPTPNTIRQVESLSCGNGMSTRTLPTGYGTYLSVAGWSSRMTILAVTGTVTMDSVVYPVNNLGPSVSNNVAELVPVAGKISVTGGNGTPYEGTLTIY